MTKKHEKHYKGAVKDIYEELELASEGTRLKGEVTLVIGPGTDEDHELKMAMKGTGFDPKKDSEQKVNIVKVAKKLHEFVEMADDDFRKLLRKLFPDVPSYHIDALIKIARKKDRKERQIDRITSLLGGPL